MESSPPGSSVHGILQARIVEWAIPFSRGSSWPRDWTLVSLTAGRFFTVWTTKEAPENMNRSINSTGIESEILKLSKIKSSRPEIFTSEFHWTFKEEVTTALLKFLQKSTEEQYQIHSMRPPVPWYQNHTKISHTQKENYRPITLMNMNSKILIKYCQIEPNNTSFLMKRIMHQE